VQRLTIFKFSILHLFYRKVQKDDYLVYNCLEQAASVGKFIDDECQHFLWIWKHAQTENPQMQEDAIQTCRIKKVESIAPGKLFKTNILLEF
jgi:hypothetical protein